MTREEKLSYSKEVYERRKAHNVCVRCGKEDAEPGITFCIVCKMDERERAKTYYRNMSDEKRKATVSRKMARYNERKAKGLCTKCGEPAGKTNLCEAHREADKWYKKRRYLKMQSLAAEVEND